MTRRSFSTALAGAVAAPGAPPPSVTMPVCAFSKHFHWLPVGEAATLAAEIGYDGLDLTVRKGGHIEPARVADDLPRAVEHTRAAGLVVPMVTTDIVDAESPYAGTVLRTLARLGIERYRWGGFRYDYTKPLPTQLDEARRRASGLAALNRQYSVCAMYHTHSGRGQLGASIWDLWSVLRDFDPAVLSVNLDIGHATVEGGLGGWINSTLLVAPITRGIAVKDFYWAKGDKGWAPRWCALGEGMVNFPAFLTMLKQAGFAGPVQLHMEYEELGAAHSGQTTSTITRAEFVRLCRRDLEAYRGFARQAGV